MNGSFAGAGFGRGFGSRPFAAGPGGMWDAMENLRASFEQRTTPRMGRGDVRAAVLVLLAEQPMHGYQIIQEIEQRSGGAWKPSAGSVYPTLQMLADEGLISAQEANGRKTYALTDAGRTEADADGDRPAPWETPGQRDGGRMSALPKAGFELAQAVAQVGRTGTSEQVQQAVEILDDARRRVYALLAQH